VATAAKKAVLFIVGPQKSVAADSNKITRMHNRQLSSGSPTTLMLKMLSSGKGCDFNQSMQHIGLESKNYGTHSLRRTKATLIYRRTKNLRAVQLLLGHSKIESTVRYLGIELDDALEIAEQTEI